MKVYTSNNTGWGTKFNVVDENGVFVGFDFSGCCCEEFGYFFSTHRPADFEDRTTEIDENNIDQTKFRFDPGFFYRLDYRNQNRPDGGSNACFRLVAPDGDELFLVIYNHHNGYYSHGFTFATATSCLQEGFL